MMMKFSLWKQLKKRLRRGRRPMWTLGSFLIGLAAVLHSTPAAASGVGAVSEPGEGNPGLIRILQEHEEPLAVQLHRRYICGEETKPFGQMTSAEVIRILMSHPEWTAMLSQDGQTVLLEEKIEDFSQSCKGNVYIGLDKQGYLSLFEGAPKKEKVVKTFFQLDVRYMESSLPQDKVDRLSEGIKISDMDEYNSVLSTYSDFAMPANQKVMKPTY
ncbi:BofC C-terminal domain-containing protein [Paenibacillus glycanilyticus]|uniref:BofC C-terminal domain-containing protein n=1 Tax=Paenibacillus glycanilyticus TaxID=126569 RepID=UPI00203B6C55|nr:BofC C-terminal domain-containing protein [Paenibacillus glycanilyticus]MCM3630106.1 BofC C-terminal domain-containing protein [Paenibacillus glycanilyticus]